MRIILPITRFDIPGSVYWRRLVHWRKIKLDRSISRRDCWLRYTKYCEQEFSGPDRFLSPFWDRNGEKIVKGRERARLALEEVIEAARSLYEAQDVEARFQILQLERKEKYTDIELVDTPNDQYTEVQDSSSLSSTNQGNPRKRKASALPLAQPPPKRLVTSDIRTNSQKTCPFLQTTSKKSDLARCNAVAVRSLRAKTSARLPTSIVRQSLNSPPDSVSPQPPDRFRQYLLSVAKKVSVPIPGASTFRM